MTAEAKHMDTNAMRPTGEIHVAFVIVPPPEAIRAGEQPKERITGVFAPDAVPDQVAMILREIIGLGIFNARGTVVVTVQPIYTRQAGALQ